MFKHFRASLSNDFHEKSWNVLSESERFILLFEHLCDPRVWRFFWKSLKMSSSSYLAANHVFIGTHVLTINPDAYANRFRQKSYHYTWSSTTVKHARFFLRHGSDRYFSSFSSCVYNIERISSFSLSSYNQVLLSSYYLSPDRSQLITIVKLTYNRIGLQWIKNLLW